jgi:glucosyl-dolichyl phosphate glucuronosyltransferase
MPTATVIIATYNRAELLDECLRHLALQDFTPGDEVLIADNGSTDDTADVVARHAARFPAPLSRLMVTTPGKSHAVAAALRVASGDIVALTDDDGNVGNGWLTTLKQVLADPATGLAGGPVAPRWQHRAPKWLRIAGQERLGAPLGLLDYGENTADLGARTLLGANMAVRRQVLDAVGGYAAHLGKLRGTLLSGEDHELCERVQAAGYGARYVPSARVTHWVPADRMRLSYFMRWFYWSGITNAAMQSGQVAAREFKRVPGWLVRQFAGGIATAVACALTGRLAAAVDGALDSAFAVGYAASRVGLVHVSTHPTPSIARSA